MRHSWLALVGILAACSTKVDTAAVVPALTYGTFGIVTPAGIEPSCTAVVVDPATCKTSDDASVSADASTDVATDVTPTGYGPTHKGAVATDDDCKYVVKWQSSAAAVGTDVYFQVDVDNKSDGKPATHLAVTDLPVYAEVYIDNGSPVLNHPAPNSGQHAHETDVPGRYIVGPIRFDGVGDSKILPTRWTVRFHLYPNCDDGDTSPHGHVAFFFDVATKNVE